MECEICGFKLEFNRETAYCLSCGAVYEVRKVNGKPEFSTFLLGALTGFILGFAIGWPVSRAVLATAAGVTLEELERRIKEWARRRK